MCVDDLLSGGLTHHDISFSGTAAGGYLLLEKILNKIRLSAMTNGENKGSSREVKVLTNMFCLFVRVLGRVDSEVNLRP